MMQLHSKAVKVLFIALIMFVSTVSLWAQGEVFEGSSVMTLAYADIKDLVAPELASSFVVSPSDWLPPSLRPATTAPRSNIVLLNSSWVMTMATPRVPPNQEDWSLIPIQPVQSLSLAIQAVPEPSTFELGGLAIGIIALTRLIRHQKVWRVNVRG